MTKRTPIRTGFAILASLLTLYLISGFRYNDKTKNYAALSLLSGLAPPAHYNFFLEKDKLDPTILSKYSSYTKCANDIPCFKDYYQGLSYAKESQKPIMIDFTGHGCVNCRKTEEHIWIDDRVRNILTNELVLISLYVDDDKKLDEVLLAKQSQKKLRNVGNQWADFQIVNFEQNSQPLYVVMTNEEQVLASPRGYEKSVAEYYAFLNCALGNK
jgi:thiol:disulfide interchange protein DsbD